MRGNTISPAGNPLVSISVSLVALRLLLKAAEPRLLGKSSGVSAFVGFGVTQRLQNPRSRGVGLLPWAHAHPIEAPIVNTRPPRVLDMPDVTPMPDDTKISGGAGRRTICAHLVQYAVAPLAERGVRLVDFHTHLVLATYLHSNSQ